MRFTTDSRGVAPAGKIGVLNEIYDRFPVRKVLSAAKESGTAIQTWVTASFPGNPVEQTHNLFLKSGVFGKRIEQPVSNVDYRISNIRTVFCADARSLRVIRDRYPRADTAELRYFSYFLLKSVGFVCRGIVRKTLSMFDSLTCWTRFPILPVFPPFYHHPPPTAVKPSNIYVNIIF